MPAPQDARRRVRVEDPDGLHARPCTAMARSMRLFRCDATVSFGGRDANPRSVLELLSLAVLGRDEIEIRASGGDAEACVERLVGIVTRTAPDD